MYFKYSRGELYCQDCLVNNGDPMVTLSPGALTALRHIVYSDFEKVFAFSLSPQALEELGQAAEAYCVHILQKRLKTLDFYTSLG